MAKSPPPNSYCIYQVIADFTNTEVILLEATTPDPDGDYRPIRRWTTHAGLPNRRPRQVGFHIHFLILVPSNNLCT